MRSVDRGLRAARPLRVIYVFLHLALATCLITAGSADGATPFSALAPQHTSLTGYPASLARTNAFTTTPMVAAGAYHNILLKSDGTVWACGDNQNGELGIGTTVNSEYVVPVNALSNVIYVGAGSNFSVAVLSDGAVWEWGANTYGELGNGTTTQDSTPAAVNATWGGFSVTPNLGHPPISVGSHHVLAISPDGWLNVWGDNSHGQLGTGDYANRLAPTPLNFSPGTWIDVAAGHAHSLALRNDGTVWAWGDNTYGQLGDGTTTSSPVPVQVPGLSGVTNVMADGYASFAWKSDGSLWAWGYNAGGTLGNGTTTVMSTVPVEVSLPGAYSGVWWFFRGTYLHSMLLKPDQTLWAWGLNNDGQLGIGTTANSDVPVQVPGSWIWASAGEYHSIAISASGDVYTWGDNSDDQLCNGTTTSSEVPVNALNAGGTPSVTPEAGWWYDPNLPGMGFTIEQNPSSGRIYMAGYLYATSGEATWYSSMMSASSGSTMAGPLMAYSGGQTLTGPYQPVAGSSNVGTAQLTFSDASDGTLSWPGGTIPIQRFDAITGGSSTAQPAGTPQTGWWYDPSEPGTGYSIEIQFNASYPNGYMFMAGYMYDAFGNPTWFLSYGPMTTATTYQGTWAQFANGITLTGPYQSESIVNSDVGAVTLQFTGTTTATLTLPNGTSMPLTRFQF